MTLTFWQYNYIALYSAYRPIAGIDTATPPSNDVLQRTGWCRRPVKLIGIGAEMYETLVQVSSLQCLPWCNAFCLLLAIVWETTLAANQSAITKTNAAALSWQRQHDRFWPWQCPTQDAVNRAVRTLHVNVNLTDRSVNTMSDQFLESIAAIAADSHRDILGTFKN